MLGSNEYTHCPIELAPLGIEPDAHDECYAHTRDLSGDESVEKDFDEQEYLWVPLTTCDFVIGA